MARSPAAKPAFPWKLLWVFLAVLAGVAATGVWSVLDRREVLYSRAEGELESVADLKVMQIERWLNERIQDGWALQSGPVATGDVPEYIRGRGGELERGRIENWLKSTRASYEDYDGVFLVDRGGKVLLSDAGEGVSLSPSDMAAVSEALKDEKIRVADFHADPDGRIHLALVVPLGGEAAEGAPAVLVAWINPERYLFPLLQRRPVPTPTGETLLVRRDGDHVVYLNELRHKKETALKLRIPMTEEGLTSALALGGGSGVIRGRGYRGEPLLAFAEPVAGTGWILLAEVDISEVEAPLWRTVPLIVGMTLALALAALMGTFLLWRRREAQFFKEMYEGERRRLEAEERFVRLAKQAPGMIYIFIRDPSGRYSLPFSTPQIRDIFSVSPEEVENDFGPLLRVVFPEDMEPFLRSIEKSAESLSPWECEFRVTSADRGLRWISAHSLPQRLPDGTIEWHGFAMDVTDRKLTEARIAESEEKFRRIAEQIPDIVVRFDRELRHLYVSPAVEKYTGIPAESFVGKTNEELGMPPESVAVWNEHFRNVFETGGTVNFEFGYRRGDRDYTFSASFSPEFGEDGSVSTILGVSHDISERKRMEEELKRSEARFRSYFELPILGVAVTSTDKGWLEVNDRACALLGYSRDELRGITWAEITHPDDLASDVARFEQMINGEIERYSLDKRFIRKDGDAVWVSLAVGCVRRGDGAVDFVVALMQDITDRKRAEEELARSRAFLRETIDAIPAFVCVKNLDGTYALANRTLAEAYGTTVENLEGRCDRDFSPTSEEVENFLADDRRVIESRTRVEIPEERITFADGSVHWLSTIKSPIVEDDGGCKSLLAVAMDITDRKLAEDSLAKERTQLLSIFDGIEEPIYISDVETYEILYVNRALRELAGSDPVGRKCYEALQGFESPCPFCTNGIILETGGKPYVWEYHNPKLGRDYRLTDRLIEWTGGRKVRFELAIDVTERKRAEEELLSYSKNLESLVEERTRDLDAARIEMFAQAKLSAMGRMGAGLAHQLNSPLGGATLLVDGLIESLGGDRDSAEALKHVRGALDNMHNIVECMLTLSMLPRRGRVSRAEVDLSKAIGSILDLALHDCTGRGIEISRRLAAGLPMITARPGELDQIFLNLVNNAVDAMPSGGRLSVETGEADGVVEVRVSDTGEGIAPENMERIFEPFYTTRRARRGVGLGLPVVREIVERYGGTISVESEVGKGTIFTVRIPASGLKDEETPSEK